MLSQGNSMKKTTAKNAGKAKTAKLAAPPNESKQIAHSYKVITQGNLWPYVLSIIKKDGKVYAYQLDSIIEKRFGFLPGKVMLYLVLYSLEESGMVKSSFVERRKYYTITDKGKTELKKFKNLLARVSSSI